MMSLMGPLSATADETARATVICFGDSITKRGFPKLLGEMLNVDSINAGVGGNTTAKALRRMTSDVLAKHPDVVVILFGTNDSRIDNAKVHVSIEKYAANLERMIDECARQNAQVVLCTIPPINPAPYFTRHRRAAFEAAGGLTKLVGEYRLAAMRVAASRKVSLVDLNQLLVNEETWLSPDGVHPSEEGNAIIARYVARSVRPLLKKGAVKPSEKQQDGRAHRPQAAAAIPVVPPEQKTNHEHFVRSAEEFESLIASKRLAPGDVIIWADGVFEDVELDIAGVDGTGARPITLRAATPGGVILRGESRFNVGSRWWVIEGFHFEGIAGAVNSYNTFQFRSNGGTLAQHVRLTNCAMTNLRTDQNTSKWVLLFGRMNEIDHCHFSGKDSKGALVTVELGGLEMDSTAGHRIERNYFGDIALQPGSDNETIRIGYSGDQNKHAKCVVRKNLFVRCNGENEIVSNKSSFNNFEANTFRQCNGALVLRHGHHARVVGNFFFGDGARDAGGVRVSDSHHVIANNYFQDLNGTEWNAAFSILGGDKRSGDVSSGYQAVDGIAFINNSILHCKQSILLSKAKGSREPTGSIANNLVYSSASPLITAELSPAGLNWVGNLFAGAPIGADVGGIASDPVLRAEGGLWRPHPSGPAANAAAKVGMNIGDDMDGQTRPASGRDIGADEIAGEIGGISSAPLKRADVGVSYLRDRTVTLP